MPNNLVFNNVARDLKTQIYGNDGGTVRPIAVDDQGRVLIGDLGTISYLATVDTVNYVASVDTVNEVANVASVD
ncbi:MAG: hypothetical protein AB2421_11390, partial [Thermotaleaceae bacterium]